MATCPVCGNTMAHFKNPDRDICPTPQRHLSARQAEAGRVSGLGRRGKPNPASKGNLPRKGGRKK